MSKGDLVIKLTVDGHVQIENWDGVDTQAVLDFLRTLNEKF